MRIEADYYFEGNLRWNLFFASPNEAGAWIAMVVPVLWVIPFCLLKEGRSGRGWFELFLLLEAALVFVLCKTYSRGALLSLGVVSVCYYMLSWKISEHRVRLSFYQMARLIVYGVLVGYTGFFSRISPAYLSSDESVGNRIDVLEGALRMISLRPLKGWGAEQSGFLYRNWFQQYSQFDLNYKSMVNGWLTITVEYGIPFLGCLLFVAFCLLLVSYVSLDKQSALGKAITLSGMSTVSVFIGVNVFSSLHDQLFLLLVLMIVVAILCVCCGVNGLMGRIGAWALFASVVLCVVVFCFAKQAGLGVLERVEIKDRDCVVLSRPGAGVEVALLPDPRVLGAKNGHFIRKLHDSIEDVDFFVLPSNCSDITGGTEFRPEWLWVFGSNFRKKDLLQMAEGAHIVLIVPVGFPGSFPEGIVVDAVVLPGIDITGGGWAWAEWAAAEAVPVFYLEESALDIRNSLEELSAVLRGRIGLASR